MSEQPEINPEGVDIAMVDMMVRQGIPHCGALGIRVIKISRAETILALPYNPDFVGDPASGVLNGGVVTSLVDTVCGMAVFAALRKMQGIATLDLRIDYLKPARAEAELHASATVYRLTRTIAFVRAHAYHPDKPEDSVASCVAAFMIGSSDRPPLPANAQAAVP